jgi:hypothetical protein
MGGNDAKAVPHENILNAQGRRRELEPAMQLLQAGR